MASGSHGCSLGLGRPLGWSCVPSLQHASSAADRQQQQKLSIKYTLPQRLSCVFPGLLTILLLVSMKTNCSFHKHKLPSGPETLVGVFISRRWDLQTVRKILARWKWVILAWLHQASAPTPIARSKAWFAVMGSAALISLSATQHHPKKAFSQEGLLGPPNPFIWKEAHTKKSSFKAVLVQAFVRWWLSARCEPSTICP